MNGEFLLDSPGVRAYVLEKLGDKLDEHDCAVFAYCLMSNQIDLAALVGKMRADRLLQGLLCGTAMRINLVQDRIGHVFANRFANRPLPRERAGDLVAYIHNSEQRDNLVASPRASRWSSHRAYLGRAPEPDWLAVDHGLTLCGFDGSDRGRKGFDELVVSRSHDPRQPDLSELPTVGARAWGGRPDEFMAIASMSLGLEPHAIRIPNRTVAARQARGAMLLVWCDALGRRAADLLACLNATPPVASRALGRARSDAEVQALAEIIASSLDGLDAAA